MVEKPKKYKTFKINAFTVRKVVLKNKNMYVHFFPSNFNLKMSTSYSQF